MDKLKPVIQHHFWIIFGMVLILPIIGWMPAVSQFSQQTASKITTIDQAFSQVPNGPQPNETWGKGLDAKAEQAEQLNEDARYGLWKRQEAMMTWPNTIRRDLQPKSYREEISPIARNIYRNNYLVGVRNVWQMVNPFSLETGKGTVLFNLEQMPTAEFGDLTPTSEQLWDAQEDLWLLESLLKSIRRANSGSTILTDSLVRRINVLQLVGGEGEYPEAPASSDGFSDDGGMPEFMDDGMDGGGRGGFNLSGLVSGGGVAFDPADEFGKEQGRYVHYKPNTIFKKRGFYLEAIIDHQRLPELLAVLSNGTWPVTITRVQMAQVGAAGGASLLGGDEGDYGMEAGSSRGFNPRSRPAPMMRPTPGPMPGRPGMGLGGRRGETPTDDAGMGTTPIEDTHAGMAAAAVFGPQLATVAISGVIHIYNPPENLEELRQRALAPRTPAATPRAATPAPAAGTAAPATPAAQPGDVPAVPEPQPDDLPLLDQPTDQPMLDQPTTDQPTDQPVPDTELNDATPAEPAPTDSPDVPETPEQPVIPE